MGLETGTYISSLNASNPVTGDNKTEGDDHIRLIKATLLATFPGWNGPATLGGDGNPITFSSGSKIYDTTTNYIFNAGSTVTNIAWYFDSVGPRLSLSSAGVVVAGGVIKGNGGGSGLGAITISTSAASGGSSGDIWVQY